MWFAIKFVRVKLVLTKSKIVLHQCSTRYRLQLNTDKMSEITKRYNVTSNPNFLRQLTEFNSVEQNSNKTSMLNRDLVLMCFIFSRIRAVAVDLMYGY